MGENTYASVVDPINQDNKYSGKLNKSSKFQEHLKKLHLVKFQQALTQQQVTNKEKSNDVVQAHKIYHSDMNHSS